MNTDTEAPKHFNHWQKTSSMKYSFEADWLRNLQAHDVTEDSDLV